VVRSEGRTFLEVQQGTRSAPWALMTGRIRLSGNRRLFLTFPAVFALDQGESVLHRLLWHARRRWRAMRSRGAPAGKPASGRDGR